MRTRVEASIALACVTVSAFTAACAPPEGVAIAPSAAPFTTTEALTSDRAGNVYDVEGANLVIADAAGAVQRVALQDFTYDAEWNGTAGIAARAPSDVFVRGCTALDRCTVFHWDGARWSAGFAAIGAISGIVVGPSDAWALGQVTADGRFYFALFRHAEGAWTEQTRWEQDGATRVRGFFGGDGEVWAHLEPYQSRGELRRWSAGALSTLPLDPRLEGPGAIYRWTNGRPYVFADRSLMRIAPSGALEGVGGLSGLSRYAVSFDMTSESDQWAVLAFEGSNRTCSTTPLLIGSIESCHYNSIGRIAHWDGRTVRYFNDQDRFGAVVARSAGRALFVSTAGWAALP